MSERRLDVWAPTRGSGSIGQAGAGRYIVLADPREENALASRLIKDSPHFVTLGLSTRYTGITLMV